MRFGNLGRVDNLAIGRMGTPTLARLQIAGMVTPKCGVLLESIIKHWSLDGQPTRRMTPRIAILRQQAELSHCS